MHFVTFLPSIFNFPPSLLRFSFFSSPFPPFSLPLFYPGIRQQKFPGDKCQGGTLPHAPRPPPSIFNFPPSPFRFSFYPSPFSPFSLPLFYPGRSAEIYRWEVSGGGALCPLPSPPGCYATESLAPLWKRFL